MMQHECSTVVREKRMSMGSFGSVSDGGYMRPSLKRALCEGDQGECKDLYETKKYHRLIEKRRRDRINECIYQLKDLLPEEYKKSTCKPMEKAVVLELVVQYMQTLADKRKKKKNLADGEQSCTQQTIDHGNDLQQDRVQHDMPSDPELGEISDAVISVNSDSLSECNLTRTPSKSIDKCSLSSDSSKKSCSTFSSSSLSSSPSSDTSLLTDNSDSSSSNSAQVLKRKVFVHHRAASVSNQTRHQSTSTPSTTVPTTVIPVAGQGSQNMPVFINMPFMMNPAMMPTAQYKDMNGSEMPSSCVMKASTMQLPTGMMVPQMTTNLNNGTAQVPSFFMASNSCTTGGEQDPQQQQMQTSQMMPTLIQPAMVMPFRNQGAIFCMPQFPMMPQLQGAMLSMQPTKLQTTDSGILT